jgi:choline dehydrogenase
MTETSDFIIVGAGSAGCVLANRLTTNGCFRVLLLEAGGTNDRFFVKMPLGFGKLFFDESLNWKFQTEPDARLGDRSDYWPRGKILGGSSSINAMVYIRGHKQDYDDWAALGNAGWGYDDVLPYFKKSEDNERGADEFHGADGPLKISGIQDRAHPAVRMMLKSAEALQYPWNDDFNGQSQEGVGLYQFAFRNGRRSSNANAFLDEIRSRENLTVRTNAHVTKLKLDGNRATGIQYRWKNELHEAGAAREVVMSAGAIGTPFILQHSGIGPGAVLRQHGIQVLRDAPVGKNLQDHAQCGLAFRVKVPTMNDVLGALYKQVIAGMQYVLARKGPLTYSINQGGAFLKTRPDLDRPDTQFYFLPMTWDQIAAGQKISLKTDRFSGVSMNASPCRPESRGRIEIKSGDMDTPPAIYPNYLSTPNDLQVMVDSLKILLRIAETKPVSDIIEQRFRPPGKLGDAELGDYAKASCKTTYHPASTCTMGPNPETAVVDSSLKVHGVDRLRVIDASIIPLMVSGNTNAVVTMIGEKGADLILNDHR